MDTSASSHSYSMENDHRKLGIWVFLASESIFFAAVISTFVIYRNRSTSGPGPQDVLTLIVPMFMTLVLLISSLTMVLALQSIREGQRERMVRFLIATASLGLVFLMLKGSEYYHLFSDGVTPNSNIFGSVYFTTTGLHALHVIVGIIWILSIVARTRRGAYSPTNFLPVEMAGLYWHFVDLVWVLIFMVVYLMDRLKFV
jgi:cytochrome c oxidase subunit III